jgi:protein-S-isoprenylcysteine O-methyltransferase Ste14
MVTLALLVSTTALQVAHTSIHVVSTLVWKRADLPTYDTWVGYSGALAWFLLVIFDHSTLGMNALVTVPAGALLVALGLYVHGVGIRDLIAHRKASDLVTQGIYARFRHPIYYGWVLVSFGMPLLLMSQVGLVTAPLWSALIAACGVLEERDMRRRFPDGEYESYSATTWF